MHERDVVALAWAILIALAIAGAVPGSWAIVFFPALYVVATLGNGFLVGVVTAAVTRSISRRGRR